MASITAAVARGFLAAHEAMRVARPVAQIIQPIESYDSTPLSCCAFWSGRRRARQSLPLPVPGTLTRVPACVPMPPDGLAAPAAVKAPRMLAALFRAIAALSAPPLRRVVAVSLALATASFVVLWFAVAYTLYYSSWFGWRALDWLVNLLGAVAVLGLSWLLFPAVVTLIMGFFLDRVAAAVESLDYPGRGPARPQPIMEILALTLRLMLLTIVLNLLVLPVYVLLPGINLFVFLGLNGYLLGRGYFEVVALRRLNMAATRAVRRRHAARIFIAGVMIAGLFAVPLVNLIAPVIATAFMVHIFESLRRFEPPAFAS
jgi:CysZ protein